MGAPNENWLAGYLPVRGSVLLRSAQGFQQRTHSFRRKPYIPLFIFLNNKTNEYGFILNILLWKHCDSFLRYITWLSEALSLVLWHEVKNNRKVDGGVSTYKSAVEEGTDEGGCNELISKA